jgi:hypothetical protein
VDTLRERIGMHDGQKPGELHHVKPLMSDFAERGAPEGWYLEAFEELQAQGHLHQSSGLVGGDAVVRLSADGRLFLRQQAES